MGIRRVEDMPVYRKFFDLALGVERVTRSLGPDLVRQLEQSEGSRLLDSYESALAELAYLINSIERKIKERGKAKPTPDTLAESLESYDSHFADEWLEAGQR